MVANLSEFAHRGIAGRLFRIKSTSPSESKVTLGCEFDIKSAGYVANQSVVMAYGYCNYFTKLFPSNTPALDPKFQQSSTRPQHGSSN